MRSFYLRLPFTHVETFAEYPSITRGHSFFDWHREGQDVYLWAGRLHVQISLPRVAPATAA